MIFLIKKQIRLKKKLKILKIKNYFFLSKTLKIIKEYKNILNKPIVVSFTSNNQDDTTITKEKNELVNKYISVVKLYKTFYPTNIDLFLPENENKNTTKIYFQCENCNKNDIEDNVCLNCGMYIYETDDLITSYCDSRRICINSKNRHTNSRIIHFKECLLQYHGK